MRIESKPRSTIGSTKFHIINHVLWILNALNTKVSNKNNVLIGTVIITVIKENQYRFLIIFFCFGSVGRSSINNRKGSGLHQ